MKENAKECHVNVLGCKLPGECKGMQGIARGTYDSGCYVPWECREMQGGGREMYGSV